MTYKRFEDLPVWQAAMSFANACFQLVEDRIFSGQGDVRNQLQRSSLSISLNVAEGFERGTTNELLSIIYIARGSAGEARSILRFIAGRNQWTNQHERARELIMHAEKISRQLHGWAESLQNSDIRGARHLNAASRAEDDRARRASAFLEKLQRVQRGERVADVLELKRDSANDETV